MSFDINLDATPADIEWMTDRALQLREARLAKLGKGARLSQAEEDSILAQALIDGTKHAVEVRERAAHQAMMDQRKRDEQDRVAGKPTLRATLGELVMRSQKR